MTDTGVDAGSGLNREEDATESTAREDGKASRKARMRMMVGIGALTVLAFALRVWHLDQQSVWLDEHCTLRYLGAPDPWTYFDLLRIVGRNVVPAFHWFLYAWASLVGPEAGGLRLPFTIAGAACVPLMYAAGARLGGRWVGVAAALCLALSPSQIYRSQDLLPYAFCMPFALLSLLGMLRGLQDGDAKGLLLMLAANALLLWTHLTFVLFVLAELAFLCVASYCAVSKLWGWVAAHAAILAPWGWYVTHLDRSVEAAADHEGSFLFGLVGNLLYRDIASLQDNLPSWVRQPTTWQPGDILPRIIAWEPLMSGIVVVIAAAALSWLAHRCIRHIVRLRTPGCYEHKEVLPAYMLSAFLIVIPLCFLTVIAAREDGVTTFSTRYSFYIALPLYLAIGGIVAALPGRRLKIAAMALLAAAYGFQAAALLAADTTRPNYQGAARYISQELGPRDVVITRGNAMDAATVAYALKDTNAPLIYSPTRAMLINAVNYLLTAADCDALQQPRRSVWYVSCSIDGPDLPVSDLFESCGLEAVPKVFYGGGDILVWRVRRSSDSPTPQRILAKDRGDGTDCRETMASLGVQEADPRTQLLLFNLSDGTAVRQMYTFLFNAYSLLLANRVDLAQYAAAGSVAQNDKFAQGHVAKALVALRRGDTCSARQSFENARGCNAPADRILREFEEASCAPDLQRAAAAVEHLESMGFAMAGPWREVIRLMATGGTSTAWPPGLFPMRASDYNRLAPDFASLHIPESIPEESLERIGNVLEMENRLDEAAGVYGRILLKTPADTGAQKRLAACAEPVRVTCAPSHAPVLKGEKPDN